jgi:hypothetical protein
LEAQIDILNIGFVQQAITSEEQKRAGKTDDTGQASVMASQWEKIGKINPIQRKMSSVTHARGWDTIKGSVLVLRRLCTQQVK